MIFKNNEFSSCYSWKQNFNSWSSLEYYTRSINEIAFRLLYELQNC